MKKNLLLLPAILLLASCNLFDNYGKKVAFGENEVYYKGDGITEADARKLGKYLQKEAFFTDESPKSVQLTRDADDYLVHFVVDENKMDQSSRLSYWKFQYDIAKDVFKGEPVRIALANKKLEDNEILDPIAVYKAGAASEIFYDNSEIKKADVKKVAEYFITLGLLGADKEADAFYGKEGGVPVVRLVVNPKKITKDLLPYFSYYQEQMKEKVFDGEKMKLLLTSTSYKDLSPLPRLTSEQRQSIIAESNGTDSTTNNTALDSLTTQTTVSGVLRLKND